MPQIEVIFDIDANGILNVTAKDKGTGKEQKIRIEASSGLSEDDIKRMRDEAAANAESDKAETERISKVNAADSMIFQTEKQLKEYGDKLSGGNKTAVEGALADLKSAHESKDLARIDTAMEAINAAWQAASQEMYAAGGAEGGQPEGGGFPGADGQPQGGNGQPAGDQVTDVDYEEVDGKDAK